MAKQNKLLGKWGEEKAKEFLEATGYIIITENYRCSLGEIDLIVKEKNTLVFVEVKTRRSTAYGTPGEAVNYKKQGKYCNVALSYIQRYRYIDMDYRFDIIEVYAPTNDKFSINHLVNAFQPGSSRYYV